MSQIQPGEIVVAIDHPKNSDVYFYPTQCAVRSRLIPYRSGPGCPPQFSKYNGTGIPGQRIHLDEKARRGRITDELADDEQSAFLEDLKRSCLNGSKRISATDPAKEIVKEHLSDEDIQTWKFWMRRILDDRYKTAENRDDLGPVARLVQGNLPKLDDIAATGKVRRPRFHGRDGNANQFYGEPKESKEEAAKSK